MLNNNYKVFCICGPSGSGKSSICKRVLNRLPELEMSVSTTSRKPREGEVEGVNYFFISTEEFENKIKEGFFIEWANYNNNYYGTSAEFLKNQTRNKKNSILEIEVQGVQILKKELPESLVIIYIATESISVLEERLIGRGTESSEIIKERVKKAKEEVQTLGSEGFSDYTVLNIDLDQSVEEVVNIIKSYI